MINNVKRHMMSKMFVADQSHWQVIVLHCVILCQRNTLSKTIYDK